MEKRMVNKEKIMQFDKEKVLTPFTAHRASKGDWGLVANDIAGMTSKTKAKNVEFVELRNVDVGSNYPFRAKDSCDIFSYFCPAPYEYMQARWVEEVGLKVGDKVRITRKWKRGEREFDYTCPLFEVGKTFKVNLISEHYLVLCHETERRFSNVGAVPYFVLEKVTETHRPFANAEEFEPHENRTLYFNEHRFKVVFYDNEYVELGGDSRKYTYKELFDIGYTFNDTGEPAGKRNSKYTKRSAQ